MLNKEKKYYVYKHTSPSNKVYIGITSQTPSLRWRNGKGYRNQIFNKAIEKYGWDNITHEILYENLTYEEACEKEKILIEQYKSNDKRYGYNVTSGGDGTIGVISIWKGKHLPKETCKKISESNKGKVPTLESRKRMSEAQKALINSPDYTNPMQGKSHSSESKSKMREAFYNNPKRQNHLDNVRKTRSVNQYAIETEELIATYESITKASNETGSTIDSIQGCCAGRYKTGNGFIWRYADEEGEEYGKDA